ncbi:MAG: alpha/beta hydrolase family protein [Gemmataceae bacterium]
MSRFATMALWTGIALAAMGSVGNAQQKKAELPPDPRLGKAKTYNSYFPFTPPKTLKGWKARRKQLKDRLKVALGLWPMPKKTPLNPVIHGKIQRDGYTIEKVYFESYPGFYVTGNLYRPTNIQDKQKVPGVLCPHGHWSNGRFYENSDTNAEALVKKGAEKTLVGAKYPLQARCAMLARMGCVVFHFDMVGYADSQQIEHTEGFLDSEAELQLQSFMGLQTWNSIRSLDFLVGLPEVDAKRIGVTGASGGGTQTFILCAVDERPAVAFPAVMVSTGMQGGCICENCSYLRVDTGNIELAALFAPKPLAMTGADDWTKEIETKGYPQLQKIYALYGKKDNVLAKAFVQFKHNYNQVSREVMYNWFNKHLNLGQKSPVVEKLFVPVPPKQLSVFDDEHPRPMNAKNAAQLRDYLTQQSKKQLGTLYPKNKRTVHRFTKVIRTVLETMVQDTLPRNADFRVVEKKVKEGEKTLELRGYLHRKGAKGVFPIYIVRAQEFKTKPVVWIHPRGASSLKKDGKWIPAVKKILEKGGAVVAPDVFLTGQYDGVKYPSVNKEYAGYTWGYNRTVLANRVHDILSAIGFVLNKKGVEKVDLVGFDEAGPWVVLARALCGDKVDVTVADMNQFRFENIGSLRDEMMLPGVLKYGGMPTFTALCAPHKLYLHDAKGIDRKGWIATTYKSSGQPKQLRFQDEQASWDEITDWLLR